MNLLNFMARLPVQFLMLYGWITGRRLYSWTASPPHRLFTMLTHRAYGRPAVHYRALYAMASGLLKYRERIHTDRMNFGARVNGPVTADVLRNAALWQQAVLETPPYAPKVHANLRVSGDVEGVQLDRLISFLLMSDVFANINVFFDEQAAHEARVFALTVAEERRGWRDTECDLDAPQQIRAEMFDSQDWARIFSRRTGFEQNVNNYLKTAHPGAFVVALSLPENDDGFCDKWIGSWEEAIRARAPEFPDLTFVLLNRVGPSALQSRAGSVRSAVAFARKAGLTIAEAAILAQKADAFVGQMDIFGLAARAARRPGVYMMSPERTDLSDAEAGVIHTGLLAPNEAMAQFLTLLAKRPEKAAVASEALSDSESDKRLRHQAPDNPYSMDLSGTQHTLAVSTKPSASASSSVLSSDTGKQVTPRTVGAPRPDDLLGTQYTLVVPTYNRQAMLSRLLTYLQREAAPFSILVLDSSEAEMQQENARAIASGPANVRHVEYPPTVDPYVKIREGLGMVTTPYCSICADDDLIIVPVVRRCLEELDRDPAAVVAHGYYFNFTETSTFDLSYIVYRGKSLDGKTSLARLRTLFASYEAVLYGVYRTTVAQRVFRDVERMDTVLGRELLTSAITVIAGKTLRIPDFYYGRNTGESFSYSAWHPHQILAQAPAVLFTHYPVFRELLLEALAEHSSELDMQNTGMVIDLVMLRYLEPFLRKDVLDRIIEARLRGKSSETIVEQIWAVYVRSRRWAHPFEPLIDPKDGQFTPDRMGAGRPRDYVFESTTSNGGKRAYRLFYEFFFPEMRPPAVVNREQLMVLLGLLDAY